MSEDRKVYSIKDDNLGEVNIADEVVTIIAGLAATEVEGISSMAGNITNELVSKLAYGYAIPEISEKVQEKIKTAIETMTGLSVKAVNVRIASVDMGNSN